MTVALTSTSSAVTVEDEIEASTVGLIVTTATEPPAASAIAPAAAVTEPTVVDAVGTTVAVTATSPGRVSVDPVTVARVSVVIVLVDSAPPPAAA